MKLYRIQGNIFKHKAKHKKINFTFKFYHRGLGCQICWGFWKPRFLVTSEYIQKL